MKNMLILLILLFQTIGVSAQKQVKTLPISIGYFAQFAIQPGVKVGYDITAKEWNSSKKENTYSKSLFIRPQLAFFSQLGQDGNLLVNLDFGYKRSKTNRPSYGAYSISLGYLVQGQIVGETIQLNSGDRSGLNRKWNRYFLSTINYEFGREISKTIGWYGKLSYGIKTLSKAPPSAVLFTELGLSFNFSKKD